MGGHRTAGRMARNAGFSLVEMLVVMVIAGILMAGAGHLLGVTQSKTDQLAYHALLIDRVEQAWTHYHNTGAFPNTVPNTPDVQFELTPCEGPRCLEIRLTPNTPHRCQYWSLTTTGLRAAGASSCWPSFTGGSVGFASGPS